MEEFFDDIEFELEYQDALESIELIEQVEIYDWTLYTCESDTSFSPLFPSLSFFPPKDGFSFFPPPRGGNVIYIPLDDSETFLFKKKSFQYFPLNL